MKGLRASGTETNHLLNRLRRLRSEISIILQRPDQTKNHSDNSFKTFSDSAESLLQKLDELENELFQTRNETPSDRLRHPVKLRDRLEGLISVVAVAEASPPRQAFEVFEHLSGLLEKHFSRMNQLESNELVTLKRLAQEEKIQMFEG